MKRPNKQPSAALYTASDSLLMDECVFDTENLRGFASPARGLMIVRQGMMFVIRVSKVVVPENRFQDFVSTKDVSPILRNLRIMRIRKSCFLAVQVLSDTTTMLSGTTTLMRDFLTRFAWPLTGNGSFTPKGCVRPKCRKSPFGRFFAAQQPLQAAVCYKCTRITTGWVAMSQICVRTKSIFSVLMPSDFLWSQGVDRPIASTISQAR